MRVIRVVIPYIWIPVLNPGRGIAGGTAKMVVTCSGDISVIGLCCKHYNGTLTNNMCDTPEPAAMITCAGSEASAAKVKVNCERTSGSSMGTRSGWSTILLMLAAVGMVMSVNATPIDMSSYMTQVSTEESIGNYTYGGEYPLAVGTFDTNPQDTSNVTRMQKGYSTASEKANVFPINTRYYIKLDGDVGITGKYMTHDAVLRSVQNAAEPMYTQGPPSVGSRNHTTRDTWITGIDTQWSKVSRSGIDTGGIAMSDFVRSLCYDRCG